jgi:hypothetical protein
MQGKCAFLHYRYTKCMSEPVRVWLLGTYEFEYIDCFTIAIMTVISKQLARACMYIRIHDACTFEHIPVAYAVSYGTRARRVGILPGIYMFLPPATTHARARMPPNR